MASKPIRSPNSIRSRKRKNSRRSSNNKRNLNDVINSSVEEKLEALKNLIPSNHGGGGGGQHGGVCGGGIEIKTENLFKETADYILLLKSQVFVLQKLIDFYGSTKGDANFGV